MKLTYNWTTKYLFFLVALLSIGATTVSAQKNIMQYQTILADKNGDRIKSLDVEVLINLNAYTSTGTTVYTETHTLATGINGEITLPIGGGVAQSIAFREIDWSVPMYVEVLFKPSGFINYFSNNTTKLLSVPYAMFSLYSKCAQGCPGGLGPEGIEGIVGPQGPQGPNSSNAAQGPEGPMGPAGAPGKFEFDLRSTPPFSPVQFQVYLDDGTNRGDSKPGLRLYNNNSWQDL